MRLYAIKYEGDIARGEYAISSIVEYDYSNNSIYVFESFNYITEQMNKVGFYKCIDNCLIVDIEFDYNKLIEIKG